MTEYRIVWQRCPHRDNPQRVLFLKAKDEETARWLAKDRIEREHGFEWFSIHAVAPAPTPP